MTLTAKSIEELNKLIADMVEQGWQSEGEPKQNPDKTYSVEMTKSNS